MKKEVDFTDWKDYARADLESAGFLFEKEAHTGHVIFHCHESIEKYLKAIMVKAKMDFRFIHQLDSLVDDCPLPKKDKLRVENACVTLDEMYIAARYPTIARLTRKDAQEALKIARGVEKILLAYLE